MAPNPLLGLSIGELGGKIRSGETSPTALARAAIEALDSAGRELNAVTTVMEDRAMRAAGRAEAELAAGHDRGPLHGIPWGAKDLLAAVGAPTTWGATPFREQVFDFDSTVVKKLEQAGAVLVAKLAMVELAGGMGYEELDAAWTGPGRNPWGWWFVFRFRCCRGGSIVAFCHRVRDIWLHSHTRFLLRHLRLAPHVRESKPLRGNGTLVDAG